jgi:hypothetical protein
MMQSMLKAPGTKRSKLNHELLSSLIPISTCAATTWKCYAMPVPAAGDWEYLTVELKHLYSQAGTD